MAAIDILMTNFADFGAQRVALNAANGLHGRGHTVRMVVMDAEGPFKAYLADGIDVVALNDRVPNVPKLRVLLWPWALARLYAPHEARWLVSFTPMSNLLVLLVGRVRKGLRVMVQEHSFVRAELKERRERGLRTYLPFALLYTVLMPLYRRARCMVVISDAMKTDFAAGFGIPAAVMHRVRNPLDVAKLDALRAEAPALPPALAPHNGGRRYVLGVGRLVPQKAFGRLIRVFAMIAADVPDVDVVICGQGPLREAILAEAVACGVAGRVHMVGFQPNPYAWMARAAAFALTSDWEGLPQVLAEAMLVGCPVVAHACPSGPDEMIADGTTGWLAPYEDEPALAAALKDALTRPAEAARRAGAAREAALSEYGMGRYLNSMEALLA